MGQGWHCESRPSNVIVQYMYICNSKLCATVQGDGERERRIIEVYGAGIDFGWWLVVCRRLDVELSKT